MAPYSLAAIIQVSGSPRIQNWFEKMLFTPLRYSQARAPTLDKKQLFLTV